MSSDSKLARRSFVRNTAAVGVVGAVGAAGAAARNDRRVVGVASPAAAGMARSEADSFDRVLDFGDVGTAVVGRFSDRAVERLRTRGDVNYVERDGTVRAQAQSLPYGVDRVDAEVAHANGETGAGADVAIVDTGIDSDHPDLRANVGTGRAFVNCSGSNCSHPWDDDNDHGTHVAGVADAVDNGRGVVGVATDATLHSVKVLDDRGPDPSPTSPTASGGPPTRGTTWRT